MHIDVRIPWEPGRRLGYACNRMMKTVEDWAIILDWDVLMLNAHWYDMCSHTIEKLGHSAGLISCMTNRIGCALQREHHNDTDDIGWHMNHARQIEIAYRGILDDVTYKPNKLSGMFFMTHREAWDKVGGVPGDKFIGMDNYYHDRIREAGYRIYIMRDLYVFHNYRRQWKTEESGAI